MTDKDGKKLQIGSIIAARKRGRTNFTIKGKVVGIVDNDTVRMYDFDKMFVRTLDRSEIKRVRYKGKDDATYVDF